jgi:hypothetical protein
MPMLALRACLFPTFTIPLHPQWCEQGWRFCAYQAQLSQQVSPVLQHEQSFVQLHIHFTIMLENANDATHAGGQPATQRAQ